LCNRRRAAAFKLLPIPLGLFLVGQILMRRRFRRTLESGSVDHASHASLPLADGAAL
jgi:hypothetical protein